MYQPNINKQEEHTCGKSIANTNKQTNSPFFDITLHLVFALPGAPDLPVCYFGTQNHSLLTRGKKTKNTNSFTCWIRCVPFDYKSTRSTWKSQWKWNVCVCLCCFSASETNKTIYSTNEKHYFTKICKFDGSRLFYISIVGRITVGYNSLGQFRCEYERRKKRKKRNVWCGPCKISRPCRGPCSTNARDGVGFHWWPLQISLTNVLHLCIGHLRLVEQRLMTIHTCLPLLLLLIPSVLSHIVNIYMCTPCHT